MNDHHRRSIAITFRHVDELLRKAGRALSGEDSESPFNDLVPDAAPVQFRVIVDYARRTRGVMTAALRRLNISVPPPAIPATRSASVCILAAEIGIQEIGPRSLRGYGELAPEDAAALDESYAEILELLRQMRAYLEAGPAADLDQRLEVASAPGRLRDLLQELTRVITTHGLVVFRPNLERLVEGLENDSFEIAVFGRVSSGKSSLLNHILGGPVLPVGVTPVTALVARLVFGQEPRVVIHFATEQPRIVGVEDLRLYATEQENPSNQKLVTDIRVEVPSEHLRHGITFVDTPGLGSLAGAGKAETMAYLPRADLGVVLIDATATVAPEDLLTLDTLVRAGVRAMVVLSKADLLDEVDRRRVLEYTAKHLQAELGVALPVHLVSVVGADVGLTDAWFDIELKPLLEANQQQRAESVVRKVGLLRDHVLALLANRVEHGEAHPRLLSGGAADDVDRGLRQAEILPEKTFSECLELTRDLVDARERLLARLSSELTGTGDSNEAHALLVRMIEEHVTDIHRRVITLLEETRRTMEEALSAAEDLGVGATPISLPGPQGLPSLDVAAAVPKLDGRQPLFRWMPAGLRRRQMMSQIRTRSARDLGEALRIHSRRMEEWCRQYLSNLAKAFQACAGPYRALREHTPSEDGPTEAEKVALENDIRKLESFSEEAG